MGVVSLVLRYFYIREMEGQGEQSQCQHRCVLQPLGCLKSFRCLQAQNETPRIPPFYDTAPSDVPPAGKRLNLSRGTPLCAFKTHQP